MNIVKTHCWMTMFLAIVLLGMSGRLVAQDDDAESDEDAPLSTPPIVVFNVAGVDRVMEDIAYLFGSVERKDMVDVVDDLLANAGNLSGLQRDKPAGVMLFLEPGLTPRPAPVAYLPVEDASDLIETLGTIGVTAKEIGENRYELSNGEAPEQYVRLIDGYAFMADDELSLDREFPNPAEAFGDLSTRYDLSVDVRPENIPPGMRELFLGIVRSRTQAELQQRDDEPDGAYALRKSQGLSNLRLIENLLTETRAVTLGLDVSQKSRQAVFEVVVEAEPESAFLESLQDLAEDPSRFTPILDEEAAIAVLVNSKLDEKSVEAQAELLEEGQATLARALTRLERGETAEETAAVDPIAEALARRLFEPLQRLVEERNLDGFAQFRVEEDGEYVLIGGVEIPGAEELETPLREIVDRILGAKPEAAAAVRVEYGAAEAGDVTLHRLVPNELDEDLSRVYGEDFAFYVGFDDNAVWLGLGGRGVVEALDRAVTEIDEAGLVERNRDEAPFSMTIHANQMLGLGEGENDAAMPREAFSGGGDTLRMDFRPTETGGRLRVELEEGFIRLLGLGVSRRYDESQL